MVYSALTNYSSGNVPTAAQLNQAQDNFASLRLFNDQGVKLFLAADQLITNATTTVLLWGEIVDAQVGSFWALSPNPGRLTAAFDMIVDAILNVEWLTSSSGERSIGVRRASDSRTFSLPSNGANQGGGNQSGMLPGVFLAAGDYLEAFVRHTNGSSISVHGGAEDRTSLFVAAAGVL